MLFGDKTRFLGIVLGLSFSSLIIIQQASIFTGLMRRTFGFISDTSQADIWVMDKQVQFVDDFKPIRDTQLFQIRGVSGVKWAVPFYKGLLKVKIESGNLQMCNILGIDDATLIGAPPKMIEGRVQSLREPDAIIINKKGSEGMLAENGIYNPKKDPVIPMRVGDITEINDQRAKVVGICESLPTFMSQPVIYTTYKRALSYAPSERKNLSYILVKADKGVSPKKLASLISQNPELTALTNSEFKKLTIRYFMENTGIPLNFGIAVLMGIIIGIAISGQTFYQFILNNLPYLATLKAMGVKNTVLTKMVIVQAIAISLIGWGIGMGLAAGFGLFSLTTDLSFFLMWQIYVFSGILMFSIVFLSAMLALKKVYSVDPAIAFRG